MIDNTNENEKAEENSSEDQIEKKGPKAKTNIYEVDQFNEA